MHTSEDDDVRRLSTSQDDVSEEISPADTWAMESPASGAVRKLPAALRFVKAAPGNEYGALL